MPSGRDWEYEQTVPVLFQSFAAYPLILSDDAKLAVYHAACAIELATEIMVDLYTFFRPPAPYHQLYVLTASEVASSHDAAQRLGVKGGNDRCSGQQMYARLRRQFGIKPSLEGRMGLAKWGVWLPKGARKGQL